MGMKMEDEQSVSGSGYWASSAYNARDILGIIANKFEKDLAEERPTYYPDNEIYKVTITVEKS